jgi:hypothetical protein
MLARVDIGTLVREIKEVHEAYPTWTLDNAFVHWFLQAFLRDGGSGLAITHCRTARPDPVTASGDFRHKGV